MRTVTPDEMAAIEAASRLLRASAPGVAFVILATPSGVDEALVEMLTNMMTADAISIMAHAVRADREGGLAAPEILR